MRDKKMTDKVKAKAEKLLNEGKSMRETASAVKISIPTLYSYFPGGAKAIRAAAQKPKRAAKKAPLKKAA